MFDQHLTQINPKPLLLSKNIVILPPHINPKPLTFLKKQCHIPKKLKTKKKPKNEKNALLAVLTCVSQAFSVLERRVP